MKKPRSTRDYGLPPLTVEEAARVLKTTPAALMDWIAAKVRPTPQQWTNWKAPNAGLPEALIRLYLTQQIDMETEKQREIRELADRIRRGDTQPEPTRPAPAQRQPEEKKRAAGGKR